MHPVAGFPTAVAAYREEQREGAVWQTDRVPFEQDLGLFGRRITMRDVGPAAGIVPYAVLQDPILEIVCGGCTTDDCKRAAGYD